MTEAGDGPAEISSSRSRRGHNFGGCSTCRRRHLKCDRKQPVCQGCRDAGLACGYHTDLTWVSATNEQEISTIEASVQTKGSARRFLYSEASRLSMSRDVQAHLLNQSVNDSLAQIDALANESVHDGQDIAIGPFRIFSSRQDVSEMPSPSQQAEHLTSNEGHYNNEDVLVMDSPDMVRSVQSVESFNFLDGALDWPDLFELDFQQPVYGVDGSLIFDTPDFPRSNYYGHYDNALVTQIPDTSLSHNDLVPSFDSRMLYTSSSLEDEGPLGGVSVSDAQTLLDHFKTSVMDHMSSLPIGEKNHWDILHCKTAILTLTGVTFMRVSHISHAAMTNLMALLAISSKHMSHTLSHIGSSDKWKQVSKTTLALAKDHLRLSLQTETSEKSVAKYKDQNMSLSAMLAFATLYDCQREARAYMIDAERVLRTRGFTKRTLSRKARMLHHIYTWTRILNESTYVLRNYKDAKLSARVKKSIKSTGKRKDRRNDRTTEEDDKTANMDDFLRLGPYTSSSGSLQRVRKEHTAGLRDVHLENTGDWPETLYMQLYGVQEEWLSLVSQTTRLANVSDTIDANKDNTKADLIQALQQRKQTLENMVCSFAAKTKSEYQKESQNHFASDSQVGPVEARVCMVQALTSATVILFYRRIRNVNPWILQGHVNDVIEALQNFQKLCEAANIAGPGSPWPCFIAGCEAITQSQRQYFVKWLEEAFSLTGFERFNAMLACMQEVWTRRDEATTSGQTPSGEDTWFHVCRDQNTHILVA